MQNKNCVFKWLYSDKHSHTNPGILVQLPINVAVCEWHTAKTQYRKFKTNIPIKGIARPQSQFSHSCVCERFIYSHDRSAYSAAGKYVDRSWKYLNRSQTHECGNWDWGHAVPFLGIHKWDFRCTVGQQSKPSVPTRQGAVCPFDLSQFNTGRRNLLVLLSC